MPFREDLLNPISSAAPSGTDLRYDPVRDKIREARRAELELPQGVWKTEFKAADWNAVIKLAGDSIAERSKDLQLAVWLVDAHTRTEGFPALAPGFDFLRGLLEEFWESLYPKIEDGDTEERAAPLAWLGLRLEEPLRLLPITAGGLSWASYKESLLVGIEADATTQELRKKREQALNEGKVSGEQWRDAVVATPKAACDKLNAALTAAAVSIERLSGSCERLFGPDGPSFSRTQTAIQEIAALLASFPNGKASSATSAVKSPAAGPAVTAVPAAAQKSPEPEPARPEPKAPHASAAEGLEPVDLADAERRLAAICCFLRKKDTYDIAPFLILRGLRFGQIRYNGPDKIDGRMLEEPPTALRSEIEALAASEKWDELLDATERAMALPCGRGWLDIQRHTVKALEEKGEWWSFVAAAVKAEVRGLITDMPQLLNLQLSDDLPTADAQTKKWLEKEVLQPATVPKQAARSPVAPSLALTSSDGEPPRQLEDTKFEQTGDKVFATAMEHSNAGRVADALEVLTRQLAAELSGRGRFLRRVQMAHVLLAAGQRNVALPILNEISKEMATRSLDQWENSTALAYPLSLLLQCLDTSDDHQAERAEVYARLCRLDPVRALTLANGVNL